MERPVEPAEDQTDPRVRIKNARDIRHAVELIGGVVDRGVTGGRVFDTALVVQAVEGEEVIHRTGVPAIFQRRLQPVPTAAVHRYGQPRIGEAGFGLDVDDTGGLEPVLGWQSASDQRQAAGEAFRQCLTEHRQAFRQLHAVQPVLHVGMLAAQMDLAKAVLRRAGRLQQHLVQRRALALRDILQRIRREIVGRGTEGRLDLLPREIEPFGDDLYIDMNVAAVRAGGSGISGAGVRPDEHGATHGRQNKHGVRYALATKPLALRQPPEIKRLCYNISL